MNAPSPHLLQAGLLAENLGTRRVGRRIIVLPEIDSTNTYALQTLVRQDGRPADGTVVFAERQTAGRGRLGRTWHSPVGASLMFTTLLYEPEHVSRAAFWTMGAAVAVVRAIEASTDVMPAIRWPNDIYVGRRKLAGILVEARMVGGHDRQADIRSQGARPVAGAGQAWVAIGIGLNCLQHASHFPPEIRETATSLEIESRAAISRSTIARALLSRLDQLFAFPGEIHDNDLAAEWRRHTGDIGQRVTLVTNGESTTGRILDVHPSEGLLLQLDTGARRHFDPATTSRLH